jgi:hypothetical protein
MADIDIVPPSEAVLPKDELVLTIRVYDPKERNDSTMSACWKAIKIPRADISMSSADFIAKYVAEALLSIKNLKLKR